mmetsp:Transcript_13132/g.19658  ORF Transcript_13132/g.19658 Transcript_13132/m.19658 type:complete len:228 (+) Transcript_13132:3-686(+)
MPHTIFWFYNIGYRSSYKNKDNFISGKTEIILGRDEKFDVDANEILLESLPTFKYLKAADRNRDLQSKGIGSKTALVVRVVISDGSTTSNESEFGDSVFGTAGDSVTFSSQFDACSHGQFKISPTADNTGVSTSISNGVVTITLPDILTSQGHATMRNAISKELNLQFGVSSPRELADYAIYCLPPGSVKNSYALVNSYLSVFNDNHCLYQSGLMHEIGHNMNGVHL